MRVGDALSGADPAQAIVSAYTVLEELGIVPYVPGAREPWLCLTHANKALALQATREAPSAAFEALLTAQLRAWLVRMTEHEERCRVQERMALLSTASFEGLAFHSDGVVFDMNQRLADMLGYEKAELMGEQLIARCIAPEDVPALRARFASGDEGVCTITIIRKDASRFTAELQAKQGTLGNRPVRVVAVRDVTEREHTQALLRESEQRLRNLAEATFDLTLVSQNGIIVDASGPIEKVLGYSRENFVGRNVFDFVSIKAAPKVEQAMSSRREGSYEAAAVTASGETIPFEVVAVQTTLNGAPVRLTAVRDLRPAKRMEAERLRLQQAFERTQRLDSLGVLAGGVAHDFNNLLVAVLGHAELLQNRLRDPFDHELLQGILDAGNQAANLTAQMLAYAGRKELGPRTPMEVGGLVHELRALFDAGLSKKARVILSMEEACVVVGNRATLTQVLMNLLTNASDALADEPGTISVRVRSVRVPDERFVHALGAKVEAGHWVLIEVADTGVGMDPTTEARIFEPFFTTKEKGHGLGLAACLGIISSHGGAIHVQTQTGAGSTFSILLPAHVGAGLDEVQKRDALPTVVHRPVLAVDDEPAVRTQLRYALQQRGYAVEEAENGHAALRALEADGGTRFSAVVLDVTMPDISGVEVLRRIRARQWRVPVVLSSGYHDAALELDPGSFQGFLVKPYSLRQLFDAIEQAVARTQTTEETATPPIGSTGVLPAK